MARVRIARHPKPADTEPQEPTQPEVARERITKSEAVRRAIAAGAEQPADGVPFIKTQFGLDISPMHFSAVKAGDKRKGEARPKPGRMPRSAVEGYLAPPAKPKAIGEGDLLAAIEAIKPLVAQHGADRVKRLVDVLA
jgi:hypothetical protein